MEMKKSSSGRSTPTSREFAEQIKQLELEGKRLMDATNHLGDSLIGDRSKVNYRTNTNIADLADISSEQQTISELRDQLDLQSRETERLHKSLYGENRPLPYKPPSSALESLEIPITSTTTTSSSTRSQPYTDTLKSSRNVSFSQPQSSSHEVVHVMQNECDQLRGKLNEAVRVSEQQKEQFRATISDLKCQLQEAVIGRDAILAKHKDQYAGHDALIQRLQKSVEQLETTNRTQEQALLELNDKMEGMQKQHYIVETSLAQLRQILLERERRRGRPFYETEPLAQQSVTMLIHTVERCIQESEAELEFRQDKIKQLTVEVEGVKATNQERVDVINRESEARLNRQRDEFERKLDMVAGQTAVANDRAQHTADQMMQLQQQHEREQRIKEDHISELEGRVSALRRELDDERRSQAAKRETLQLALDESQKELAMAGGERDKAVRNAAQVQSRFNDMESQIEKLQAGVNMEKNKLSELADRDAAARAREERLQADIRGKEEVIQRLEASLAAVQKEADTQLKLTIHSMEKEGKDFIERQITQLKTQLDAMTEKCHQNQTQLEVTKTELNNVREKYTESRTENKHLKEQVESAVAKRESLDGLLKDRLGDIERMGQDKLQTQQMLDSVRQELTAMKCLKEKLAIQLEEREKNFLAVQQQNDNITQIADTNTHTLNTIRQERDELQSRINDKIIETEEIRHQRDAATKKVSKIEKQQEQLQSDNVKLAQELRDLQESSKNTNAQRESLLSELKQSRYEVAGLVEEKQNLEQKLIDKDGDFNRDVTKLNRKIRALERDLKLAQKTIKTREDVDGKAVKVAGKMQKEVTEKRGQIDSLQTRLRWLEECLDAALKDKKLLQEEGESLGETVRRTSEQNERLASELRSASQRCAEMQDKCSKLEAAVEKATVKFATTQATLEQYEQDIARLKLKHQLELKEASRNSRKQGALPPEAYKPVSMVPALPAPPPPQTQPLYKNVDEVPVSMKPQQQQQQQQPAVRDNSVGEDLKTILTEMKGLLQNQQQQNSKSSSTDTDYDRTQRKKKSSARHKPVYTSKDTSRASPRPTSPVSDLILGSTFADDTQDYGGESLMTMDTESILPDYSTVSYSAPTHKYSKGGMKSAPLASDAQALAKRLEKKIENLTKIGGQLQSDNKEVAKMMRDQEKKIKKVKTQMGKG